MLYLMLSSDLPTTTRTSVATCEDDTAIMASHYDPTQTSSNLHEERHLSTSNTKRLNTTYRARYLGMHLDQILTWKEHIWKKRKQWTLENKILLFRAILRPIWSYGMQLCGTASTLGTSQTMSFTMTSTRVVHNDLNIQPDLMFIQIA